MPNQDTTVPSPVDACRARSGDGRSLYAPDGAVINPSNGHPQAPNVPRPDPLPTQIPTPELRPLESATQSIHFWQGLAVGLGAAVVILFLVTALLAG